MATNWSELEREKELKAKGSFLSANEVEDLDESFYDVGNEVYGDLPLPQTVPTPDQVNELNKKVKAAGLSALKPNQGPPYKSEFSKLPTEEQLRHEEGGKFQSELPKTEQNIPMPEVKEPMVADLKGFAKESGKRQMIVALLSNPKFIGAYTNGTVKGISTDMLVFDVKEIIEGLS